MSVINKMLQDLDRRNAMAGAEAQIGPQSVKPVEFGEKPGERDWFWRVVAGLLLVAVGWVGWVAWQLQPRPLVIESAIRAAAPKPPPPPVAVSPVKAAPVAPEPKVEQAGQAEKAEQAERAEKIEKAESKPPAPEPKAQPAETFKLARAIETPIVERKPEPAKPKPRAAAAPKAATPVAAAAAKPKVTKTAVNEAETHFRRAAAFLNQGRVSEAQAHLALALKADPAHAPARQAYVALALEHGRVAEARELLQAGVAANPAHAPFALALARIHVEQREYAEALKVLDNAGPAGESAEFHGLRAVVLQRVGRHGDAVGAFQQALRSGPQTAATWMGLGISLEALGHRAEAAQAYKRALGAGMLAVEVRDYAEARIRALD
jgi:tetratricopeptide (TPR) repeat protein